MKKLVRAAVAAAVLSAGAVSPAFAALVNGQAGDSDASLTVFDSLNQRSIVVTLNVSLLDLLPSVMNQEAGFSIANAVNASDQAELASFIAGGGTLSWWVGAADTQGVGSVGGRQLVSTGDLGLATISVTNAGVQASGNALDNFYGRVNQVCATDTTCFADFASDAPDPEDGIAYAGNAWGAQFNGNLNPSLGNGAAIGEAQGFYHWSTPSSATASPGAQATRTAYRNAIGFGEWVLSAQGVLSYTLAGGASVVPLPAAGWLLVSGLLGLCTVARRRRETGAAVAA